MYFPYGPLNLNQKLIFNKRVRQACFIALYSGIIMILLAGLFIYSNVKPDSSIWLILFIPLIVCAVMMLATVEGKYEVFEEAEAIKIFDKYKELADNSKEYTLDHQGQCFFEKDKEGNIEIIYLEELEGKIYRLECEKEYKEKTLEKYNKLKSNS